MRTRAEIESDILISCIDIGDAQGQTEHNNLLALESLLDTRELLGDLLDKQNDILDKLNDILEALQE